MRTKKLLALIALIAVICGALFVLRIQKRRSDSKHLADRASVARTHAEQGDIKAEKLLASMYYYGRGVPQNYAAAVQWYQKGADQGDAEAEYYLSFMYHEGKGVPLDNANFLLWCRRAADQGFARAEFVLGNAYYDGKVLSQDYAEAVRWYRKAADQNDPNSESALWVTCITVATESKRTTTKRFVGIAEPPLTATRALNVLLRQTMRTVWDGQTGDTHISSCCFLEARCSRSTSFCRVGTSEIANS